MEEEYVVDMNEERFRIRREALFLAVQSLPRGAPTGDVLAKAFAFGNFLHGVASNDG